MNDNFVIFQYVIMLIVCLWEPCHSVPALLSGTVGQAKPRRHDGCCRSRSGGFGLGRFGPDLEEDLGLAEGNFQILVAQALGQGVQAGLPLETLTRHVAIRRLEEVGQGNEQDLGQPRTGRERCWRCSTLPKPEGKCPHFWEALI